MIFNCDLLQKSHCLSRDSVFISGILMLILCSKSRDMKKFLIFSLAMFLAKFTVAHEAMRCPGFPEPLTETGFQFPDTTIKKARQGFPGRPGKQPPQVTKKIAPVGTLKITTEIPATLSYDADTAIKMTRYHLVVIYKVLAGPHTLAFRNGLMESRKSILVEAGTTGYYKLRKDTTITDSVVPENPELGHKQRIVSRYVPFRHAVSFDLLPGAYFNGRGSGLNTRFEIGYNVNHILKLGMGAGYASYPTRLKQKVYSWFFEPDGEIVSEDFYFSFIPVYLDLSLNFLNNRTTTYLSFNVGASFPVTQSVSCKATYETTTYLKIDQIKTGVYLGLAVGMKYFFSPVFEGGASIGFNTSINEFNGNYYMDPDHTQYNSPRTGPHATTGFGINLMLGINLGVE